MVMGGGTQAFCGNDGCPCLTWDPSKSKAENRRNATAARITEQGEPGDD